MGLRPSVDSNEERIAALPEYLNWSSASAGSSCSSPPSGATTYGYNVLDARTSTVTGSSTTGYACDQERRLCWVATTTGTLCSSPPAGASTYSYDGDGLRTGKTVAGATTNFTWDVSGGLPLLLKEVTGSSSTSYVYGPGGLVVEQIAGGAPSWYHHDQPPSGAGRRWEWLGGAADGDRGRSHNDPVESRGRESCSGVAVACPEATDLVAGPPARGLHRGADHRPGSVPGNPIGLAA